jgi:hypothetical protein
MPLCYLTGLKVACALPENAVAPSLRTFKSGAGRSKTSSALGPADCHQGHCPGARTRGLGADQL